MTTTAEKTNKTNEVGILDLEEKSRFIEELAESLDLDKLDEAIGVLKAGIDLEKDLRDALATRQKQLREAIEGKEIFTLEELKSVKKAKKALEELETELMAYSGSLRLLEERITAIIPKPKQRFKLGTKNYFIEIENGRITKIETI